jgi:hypothetical protein
MRDLPKRERRTSAVIEIRAFKNWVYVAANASLQKRPGPCAHSEQAAAGPVVELGSLARAMLGSTCRPALCSLVVESLGVSPRTGPIGPEIPAGAVIPACEFEGTLQRAVDLGFAGKERTPWAYTVRTCLAAQGGIPGSSWSSPGRPSLGRSDALIAAGSLSSVATAERLLCPLSEERSGVHLRGSAYRPLQDFGF